MRAEPHVREARSGALPREAAVADRAAALVNDLIFDVGMNTCEDTDFYLAKGFRVVAVEANPGACLLAAKRYAAEIEAGRLRIVNRVVSESRAPLVFYACQTKPAWSTASPKLRDYWSAREHAVFSEVQVEGITTSDLIKTYGVPYYAKIDIEGFDLVCLQGFHSSVVRPKYISFEVDFYKIEQMIDCTIALGYKRFALVGQKTVPAQRQPKSACEGRDVDYQFEEGSSGLSGRELPAIWVDSLELRSQCHAVIRHHQAYGILRRCAPFVPKRVIEMLQLKYCPLACDWYDIHCSDA